MDYLKDQTVENYIDGTLSISEKQAFEQALKTSLLLQQALARKKETIQVIQAMGDVDLSDRIKKIVEEEMATIQPTSPTIAQRRWLYVLATVIASILILIVAYFILVPRPKHELLFAQYYQPIKIEEDRKENVAKELYKKEKYAQTLELLQGLDENLKTGNAQIVSMIGICYLELENYKTALEQFEFLKENFSDEKSQELALWYKGLTFLKMNDLDNSYPIFERLAADSESIYSQQAQKLLEQLKK